MLAITGRNSSCPVEAPPDRRPTTSPRRAVNQRAAMVAASTLARKPVPAPTKNPHIRMSCHGSRISDVEATPTPTRARAQSTERRMPKRSITAAANGPMQPYSTRLIDTANAMVARDQWNSSSSGTIRMPGVERMPALVSSTRQVTPTTIQP